MLKLDPSTLFVIIVLGQLLAIIIYTYYIFTYQPDLKLLKLYTFAKVLQFIAPFSSIILKQHLTPLVMTLIIMVYLPGIAIETYCLIYINLKNTLKHLIRLLELTGIFIVAYAFVAHIIIWRVIIASIFYVLIYSFLFFKLTYSKSTTNIQKLIGWISLVCIFSHLSRGLFSYLTKIELPLFSEYTVQVVFGIMTIITSFSFPLLFLFMIQERNELLLKQLISTRNKFFKIISHDLRTPVAQMVNISQLFEAKFEELDNEAKLSLVQDMKEASDKGHELLDNLLKWAQTQTHSIKFAPEIININELIIDSIGLLKKQAEQKNIQIVNHNQNALYIWADKNMIKTILRNLLTNSVKFSYQDGLIELNCEQKENEIIISVKDFGLGISKKDQERLFNINTTFTKMGTKSEKGTGLGLLLVKELVQAHNGRIWVQSAPGNGSTFFFSLPDLQ